MPGLEPLLKIALDREWNVQMVEQAERITEEIEVAKEGKVPPPDRFYFTEKQKKRLEGRLPEGHEVKW